MSTKPSKDRSRLCAFTFADGRHCRTPRCSGHSHLCYFHAQKEAQAQAAKQVGQDISRCLPTKLLTACDLGIALSRTFCAVARGDLKPKVATTLGYLAQTMLQSIPIAQHEYCEALGTDYWCGAIRSSFKVFPPEPKPAPQPQPVKSMPAPTPKPTPHPPQPTTQPAPEPPAQPAPSPHRPLPRTSAEFAQQLLAGRNSSRSEIPTLPEPGRENGSSGSSSSSTSTTPPQPSVNCHSVRSAGFALRENLRSEEPASSSNSSLAIHHSPLPRPPQSEIPTLSGPAPSSPCTLPTPNNSQPAPTPPAPQPTETPANCHSERSEESAFSSSSAPSTTPAPASPPKATPPSSLATHHSPPPQNPLPVPPSFGAPANWDVLIPPKPRRRFSRLWQSRE